MTPRIVVWTLVGAAALGVSITGVAVGEYAAALPGIVMIAVVAVALRQQRLEDRVDVMRLELDIVRAMLDGRRVRCQACGQFVHAEPADIGHAQVKHNLFDCPGSTVRVPDEPVQEPQP